MITLAAREAAKTLGYTKKMWDKGKEPETIDKDWEELIEEEKAAATVLGYDEETWDNED